jgi:hypothetical protein
MLFMKVIVVYLKNNTENRNKNAWQEGEFLNLTTGGTYNKLHKTLNP